MFHFSNDLKNLLNDAFKPEVIVGFADDIGVDGKSGESPGTIPSGVQVVGSSGSVQMTAPRDVDQFVIHRNQDPFFPVLAN